MQTFVYITIGVFLCFAGASIFLLVKLLTNQTVLMKTRMKLQDYADNLEAKVAERTNQHLQAICDLEESESRLLAIINNASAGIGMLNSDGEILQVNQKWAKMLGYEVEDFTKRSFWDISYPEDISQKREMFRKLLGGEIDHYHFESCSIKRDGSLFWGDVSITPVIGENGKIEVAIFVIADITERKIAETKIKDLSKQIMSAGEIERQKIARDLHDEIAQSLLAMKLSIETIFDGTVKIDPGLQDRVSGISNMSSELIKYVRNLSYELNPVGLEQMGLEFAVSQLLQEISDSSNLKSEFIATGLEDIEFDFNTKINLFRIIQESTNNIRKHAKASKITVKIVVSHPNIILRIEDDGIGFNVEKRAVQAITEKRMGLSNIKARVKLLSGKLDIVSAKNAGTKMIIEIPLQEA